MSVSKLIPMAMSLNLFSDNFNFVEKASKTSIKVKDIMGQGIKNILGVSLIKSDGENLIDIWKDILFLFVFCLV